MRFAGLGAVWCAALTAVVAVATPDKDSFYQPKGNWQAAHAGDILAWRSIDVESANFGKSLKEAYQILYRTNQNNPNEPQHSVTTVLVPDHVSKNKLVVAGEAQDSNAAWTAPSYGLTSGSKGSPNFVVDEALLLPYLQAGYIVTVPDSEGPMNAFAAGRSGGYITLDSVRATLSFDKLALNKNASVAGFGYSSGAQAISWAAALKDSYAPELNVVGWAFGGSIPNVTSLIVNTDGTPAAGYAVSAIAGLVDVYGDLRSAADSLLTKDGQEMLNFARRNAISEVLSKFANVNILGSKYVKRDLLATLFSKRDGSDLLSSPAYRDVARQNTQGTSRKEVPHVPMYVYHAISDEAAPYNDVLGAVRGWCSNDANIDFVTYQNPEWTHRSTQVSGSVPVFSFIQDKLSGRSASTSGCSFVGVDAAPGVTSVSSSTVGPSRVVPVPVGTATPAGSSPAASAAPASNAPPASSAAAPTGQKPSG